MHGPPGADSALQRPTNARGEFGMAPPQFVEDRHRSDARGGLQQREDLGLEDVGKWVGTSTFTPCFFLGRKPWVVLDTVSSSDTDRGLCGRDRLANSVTCLNKKLRYPQ
jgi:hypothetical protein